MHINPIAIRKILHEDFRTDRGSAGLYGPALLSAPRELPGLPYELLDSLRVLGSAIQPENWEAFKKASEAFPSVRRDLEDGPVLRKLVSFPDKEGKMRTVAILDYWSQQALRPIHEVLATVLRRIPQDCTFDQGRFVTSLGLTNITDNECRVLPVLDGRGSPQCGQAFPRFKSGVSSERFYSVDLSNATDRFPIAFQQSVLAGLFGDQVASAWRDTLVGYPFLAGSKGGGRNVHYGSGQPMGAYSSFPAFALSHHVVIRALARKLRVPSHYAILGDDIVIQGDSLGEAYMEFLESMQVPYSPAKTFISYEMLEFAKRVIFKG